MTKFLVVASAVLMLVGCSNKSSQDYFTEAEKFFIKGDSKSSKMMLDKSLEMDSCNTDALYLYITMAIYGTDNAKTEKLLNQFKRCGGDEVKYCEQSGIYYETIISDKAKAIEFYKRLSEIDKDSCKWIDKLSGLINTVWTDSVVEKYLSDRRNCLNESGLAVLLGYETNFLVYTNEKSKFSLEYPDTWVTEEEIHPEMFFWEAVEKKSGVNFNITVATDQDAPLSEWMKMIEGQIKSSGYEIIKSETITLEGLDCSFFSSKVNSNGSYLIINNYVLLNDGKAYMMNFTANTELVSQYKIIEEKMLNAFTLL